MGRTCSISAVAVCFVIALVAETAGAAEPSPWLEIHSTHYTVITDAGEKTGKQVALRFEQMRAVFGSLLMKQRLNQPEPVTILAFKNDQWFYQTAPLQRGQPISVPGFLVPGEDQNFIVLNMSEEEPWRAVARDLALLLLSDNYPPAQAWFDEGLAEYFASIRLDDQTYEIGGDPQSPSGAGAISAGPADAAPAKSFTDILSGESWLSLEDLLSGKSDAAPRNAGLGDAARNELFRAQSWITIHYLVHEDKLSETGTYLGLVENQHLPKQQAIQQAYGMTEVQLDQAVKNYFQSLKSSISSAAEGKTAMGARSGAPRFPEPIKPNDSVITSNSFSDPDARAITAEIRIRIPERREAGLQELNALATMATPAPGKSWFEKPKKEKEDGGEVQLTKAIGNEIAHRALAWDHLEHDEFEASLQELGDAAALNRSDLWVRYYLSVLKYKMSETKKTQIEGLPNMLQDLRAVLEWYPEFANAYDLMAMARMEGGGPVAALQAEHAAIGLSPRNQQYVYHLAEIYESDKKWDAARAVLQRLQNSDNRQVAAEARARLDELSTNQKYGLSSAGATSGGKLTPQPSPFDVLDQDAAKRASEEKTTQTQTTADMRPEKYLKGELVAVDCSQPPVAILTVNSGGRLLKLRTPDYKSLIVIGADAFSCSWSDRSVAVNYRSGGPSDGDLVSVEVR